MVHERSDGSYPSEGSAAAGHETKDINVRKVFLSGVMFFVLGFGSLVIIRPVFNVFARMVTHPDLATTPAPEVQALNTINPDSELDSARGKSLQDLQLRDTELLTSYALVDGARGIARVPIERAMELLMVKGLPERVLTASTANVLSPNVSPSGVQYGEPNGFSEGGVP